MERENYSSSTEWEKSVGYSRAVRCDNTIYISGTTATDDDGNVVAIGDPYGQTIQTIENIRKAIHFFEATLEDVVRTRIYVTDIDNWQEIGKAHGEYFESIRPATSMVEVSRLIRSSMLVEMEAVARIDSH